MNSIVDASIACQPESMGKVKFNRPDRGNPKDWAIGPCETCSNNIWIGKKERRIYRELTDQGNKSQFICFACLAKYQKNPGIIDEIIDTKDMPE